MKVKVGDTIANYVTVNLDGVDVTHRCTEADSLCGYVDVLVEKDGHMVFIDEALLTERKFGTVEVVLQDDVPDTARHAYEYLRANDGLTPLARSFAELTAYADKLVAGLREFEALALRYGVELDHADTHKESAA